MRSDPLINPFPGLRHFEADEEHLFFGREGQSEEILRRLRQHRFLAVVGSSGSGKSSLVRAGLLPYLYGGFLADSGSHWRFAILRPGADPIGNLAAALNKPAALGNPTADAAEQDAMLLEVSLRRSGLGLIEAVRLARLPKREQVLIVVDQFEELLRFAHSSHRPDREEDAAAFVKLMLEASGQCDLPIYVVLTMRSDFIGDCARYRDLPEAVTSGLYLIPRMTREQRRAAIVEPVRVGGGSIAPRLVVRLLNDVGDDPDQLPILQHALMRCWDHWTVHGGDRRPIDLEDYEAIGRMAEALSDHADEAYDGLPDDRHRAIARRMFQALTEKGLDSREARRPTTVATLAEVANAPVADIARIVEDFRRPGRSFLTPSTGVEIEPGSVIDISHESLIRGWRRLRQWVEDEAESARVYRRLAETAALHGLGTAGLWHDPDLAHALAWRDRENPNAAWADRYDPGFAKAMAFLERSRVVHDSERRQSDAKRRQALWASLAAASVLLVIAVVAVLEWQSADRARERAQQALTMADSEREHAQQALTTATQLANVLVVEMGQESSLHGLPPEMVHIMADRAIRGYDQVIKINPTAEAYSGRGYAHYEQKDYDRSVADLDRAIQLDSKLALAYRNRGLSYYGKKDHDRAIADFDQAIQIDPKYAYAYNGRGNAYLDKKDYDHAIADYDQAIQIDPKFAFAYNNRGNAYARKKDYGHAFADYDQAIQIDPKFAIAYNGRGAAYAGKKDYDHAIADYDRAIQIDPKYAFAYSGRGSAYLGKKDYDHAIADDDQAIQIDPKLAFAYRNRGSAYAGKKDYDRAIADDDQAIQIDPKYADAYNSRCYFRAIIDQLQTALADCNESLRLRPNDAHTLDSRGFTYLKLGQLDNAIADYDTALKLNPAAADSLYGRGVARLRQSNSDGGNADVAAAKAIQADIAEEFARYGIK